MGARLVARVALGCAAVACAVPATAAWGSAGPGPTGDPATIALYRSVAANMDALHAVRVTESGYMALAARPGVPGSFAYRFGEGWMPKGFVAATESITYLQSRGRVVWVTDAVRPAGRAPGVPAIELFVTVTGAFAGVVTGPDGAVGCFRREPFTDVPFRAGGPWWSAFGAFRAKVARGNQILVTLTYSLSSGQHVTEVDSIESSTRLFTASSVHVARGAAPHEVAFGFTQHDEVATGQVHAPVVVLCR